MLLIFRPIPCLYLKKYGVSLKNRTAVNELSEFPIYIRTVELTRYLTR